LVKERLQNPLAVYYFDSSALVKRYAVENGTDWVISLCARDDIARAVSHIGLVEIAAALASKRRGGFLTQDDYDQLLAELVQDAQSDYSLIAVNKVIVDQAIELTRRHKLRGYDAVHLASALMLRSHLSAHNWPPPIFVSADNDLLAAAVAEGLATENPNAYP